MQRPQKCEDWHQVPVFPLQMTTRLFIGSFIILLIILGFGTCNSFYYQQRCVPHPQEDCVLL